ncbi:MAG: carboxypeptidase-like regulatory domain-containing protein [Flavobacteriales bacterium]|nr:carboxypeptidase-like regulatory domain-containing protein [Flavobacteriales bacterium]
MTRSLLLTLLAFTASFLHGQQGTVAGRITAIEAGVVQPMPFVNVAIAGTTTGATTDFDGVFRFNVDPGTHVITVSFVGYEPTERTVAVSAGKTTELGLELKALAVEIDMVEVVATRRSETESAVVMETRKSDQVVNGVSREQIAKSQDRTAGDVVKRIPGVTMVSDRFVMIRGLADRYNTVMLNDVIAPSLEPDKRAFSFDILPSGALDRVMIYKSGAPELPGEFAGGVIKLYTVNVPERNRTEITYSSSYRPGSTFNTFNSSQRSSTDGLGFDDGLRQLPVSFPGNLATAPLRRVDEAGRSLANNWAPQQSTALPDQRVNVLIARRFGKEGGRVTGGNITSLGYSTTRTNYTAKNYNFNAYSPLTGRSDSIYNYSDNENTAQVRLTASSNFSLLAGSRTKLEFRNLFTQQGTDQTTLRTGRNMEEGFEVRNYAYRYQQRTIYSGQLHGSHDLVPGTSTLNWTAGYGLALNKEPDLRRIRTVRGLDNNDANTAFQVVIPPGATTLDAGRFFSESDERVMTGKMDYEHRVQAGANTLTLRTGVYAERKDRTFEARWMSFRRANGDLFDQSLLNEGIGTIFNAENINTTTGFRLEEGTNPSDRYTAANTLLAAYVGATLNIATHTTIAAGIRAEHNTQQLTSSTFGGRHVNVNNAVLSILPSVNATRALNETSQVRLAWYSTVNRPEFRELAPFSFYDFSFNNVLRGNDSLQVASIQNIDARYELYPSASETMSFGLFYKHFSNPIEMFFLPGAGSGGTRNFSYGNAQQAQSLGAEVEVRRQLNGIFPEGYLSHLGVTFNAAYVITQVQLGDQAKGQAQQRPLLGQSPYIINAGLYWQDSDRKLQYSVLYNVIGPRLFAVGTYGTPDIYELPRNVIDISVSKGLGEHFEVKLGVQDILNQRTRLIQDTNDDGRFSDQDQEVMSYRRGAYFTAGIGYRF